MAKEAKKEHGKEYEDRVLIKLYRQYEKDEVVMYALNQLKAAKIKMAADEEYIHELELALKQSKTPTREELLKRCQQLFEKMDKEERMFLRRDLMLQQKDKQIESLQNQLKRYGKKK